MNGPEPMRIVAAVLAVLLYLALCASVVMTQRRRHRRAAREAAALAPSARGGAPVLVAYASQTGFAEELAWQSARALHAAGVPARVSALARLGVGELAAAGRALLIASTCGEGDPPDDAAGFARRTMARDATLANLHYAVLALGDRSYANFCGFGRALDGWLARSGARPLFPRIDVDNAGEQALGEWRRRLGRLAGTADLPDWEAPAFGRWRLAARRHLNPGSAGGPTFHLEFEPLDGALPEWQSGDLAQVVVPDDPQHPREYSVASLPQDGRVHLLVRLHRRPDGTPGRVSGWLTGQAPLGAEVALRLRAHRAFRLGRNAQRPLLLIGNGTGLAGLRSHLRARVAAGAAHNWLVFGERHAAHDAYYRDEIDAWCQAGLLRADLVFSRDAADCRYVQDRLRAQAATVKAWLDDGAAVYVCGSLAGMAGGVDAALTEIAGTGGLDALRAEGRYRRDVY